MEEKIREPLYKIIILGGYVVGKTNFILRYVENTFATNTISTIGMDYRIKKVTLNDGKIAKIQIWDTCSMERAESMITRYFKGANGFIIMYNITERNSYEKALNWLRNIRNYTNNNNIAFVGNYVDKEDSNDYYYKRVITTEEGQKFAEDNNLLFFETSNLTGFNVNECFNALINRIYENDLNKNKYKSKFELKYGINRTGKRGCLK